MHLFINKKEQTSGTVTAFGRPYPTLKHIIYFLFDASTICDAQFLVARFATMSPITFVELITSLVVVPGTIRYWAKCVVLASKVRSVILCLTKTCGSNWPSHIQAYFSVLLANAGRYLSRQILNLILSRQRTCFVSVVSTAFIFLLIDFY